MAFESEVVFKLENINKALAVLNQTVMQLKGVSYIGDEKRIKSIVRTSLELSEAIGKEIDELKGIDAVDDAITREVNEKLLTLLREASLNLDSMK